MWSSFALSAGCSSTPVNDNQAVFCIDVGTPVAQNEMSCTLTLPGIRVQLKCPSERLQGGSLSSACQFYFFSFFCVFHVCIRAVWSHWEPLWFLSFFYASIEVQMNCRPGRHQQVSAVAACLPPCVQPRAQDERLVYSARVMVSFWWLAATWAVTPRLSSGVCPPLPPSRFICYF